MINKFNLILLFIIMLTGKLSSQHNNNNNLMLGTGVGLLGTGDLAIHQFTAGYYRDLNDYFSMETTFDIGYGFNNYNSPTSNLLKGNVNAFIAPFKNSRRYSLLVGGGITFYHTSIVRVIYRRFVNGIIDEIRYEHVNFNSFGANIIIDNSFKINNRNKVIARVFVTPFFDGDIYSGFEIKWARAL